MRKRERIFFKMEIYRRRGSVGKRSCEFREQGTNLIYCNFQFNCDFKGVRRPYAPLSSESAYGREPTCEWPNKLPPEIVTTNRLL